MTASTTLLSENPPEVMADMLRRALQQGLQPRLLITSSSMAPLLRSGDHVRLKFTPLPQLQPGDIITLAADDALYTHRYWGQAAGEELQLLTAGDRTHAYDAPWRPEQYIGQVAARQRGGRMISFRNGGGQRLDQHMAAVQRWRWQRVMGNGRIPPALQRILRGTLYLWCLLIDTVATTVVGQS